MWLGVARWLQSVTKLDLRVSTSREPVPLVARWVTARALSDKSLPHIHTHVSKTNHNFPHSNRPMTSVIEGLNKLKKNSLLFWICGFFFMGVIIEKHTKTNVFKLSIFFYVNQCLMKYKLIELVIFFRGKPSQKNLYDLWIII